MIRTGCPGPRTQSSVYFLQTSLRKITKYEQSEKEGGIEPAICLLQRQARRWNTHLLDESLVTQERRAGWLLGYPSAQILFFCFLLFHDIFVLNSIYVPRSNFS